MSDDQKFVKHDPSEGFDPSEPDSKSIAGFVIGSVVLLVAVIFSLQYYFDKIWGSMVYDRVMAVPSSELANQRRLEDWRMTHYEYTDKSKTAIRMPMERAKQLLMEEMKTGKTFYPGKGTEPKPEVPPAPADAKGKEDSKGTEQAKDKK